MAISAALDSSLEKVFPSTKKAMASFKKRTNSEPFFEDEELSAKFAAAGIDIDPRFWTLKYHLRNGLMGFHSISGPEKERLWRAIQGNDENTPFVIFDTGAYRVALNRNHLIFSQFLFDPPIIKKLPKRERDKLLIYTCNLASPFTFDVDPDGARLDQENKSDGDAQLQEFLFSLETVCEPGEVVNFTDEDGETVFFRAADIAMLSLPVWAVEPDVLDSQMELEDDYEIDEDREE
jgi:hypothetical protein